MEMEIDFNTQSSDDRIVDNLTKHLVAKKQFSVLASEEGSKLVAHGRGFDPEFSYSFIEMPELHSLKNEFDRILVRSDGITLLVYCIKNNLNSNNPTKLSLEELRQVGSECLVHTSEVAGTKMPANLFVIELSRDEKLNTEHLKNLSCAPGKQKVLIKAFQLNLNLKKIWNNLPLGGYLGGKLFFAKILGKLESPQDLEPKQYLELHQEQRGPLLSLGFIFAFIAIFILELFLSGNMRSPSSASLIALGASLSESPFEFSRWISSAYLHASYSHLIFNCIAFYIGGKILEVYLDRKTLFSLFTISAIGGSLLSLAMNYSKASFGVGASGGIMGMTAAVLLLSSRLPFGFMRTQMQIQSLYILIPSLLPGLFAGESSRTSYSAHFGGALAGAIFLFLYFKLRDSNTKITERLNRIIFFLCVLFSLYAVFFVAKNARSILHVVTAIKKFIPDDEHKSFMRDFSKEGKLMITPALSDKTEALSIKYPEDPRIRFYRSIALSRQNKFNEASIQLRKAIELDKSVFPPEVVKSMNSLYRLELARILMMQNKPVAAEEIVLSACKDVIELNQLNAHEFWIQAICSKQ